jgi:hypothetical protein
MVEDVFPSAFGRFLMDSLDERPGDKESVRISVTLTTDRGQHGKSSMHNVFASNSKSPVPPKSISSILHIVLAEKSWITAAQDEEHPAHMRH